MSSAARHGGRNDHARRRVAGAVLAVATLVLSGCVQARDSITEPVSPQAGEVAGLWYLSLALGTGVWVTVMVLLAFPVVRSRREGRPAARPRTAAPPAGIVDEPTVTADPALRTLAAGDARVRSRLLWIGGIAGPAVILALLLVVSGRVGASTAHTERDGELVIDVTGHMFWWEVRYPEDGIVTANEIHVPVDRPVRLRLHSEDVIHSFWIPRVHGKIDMIPGQENWLSFEATEPGRYRGNCAEFCGIAHAQMVAFLEVQEQEDFDAWVAQQQALARPTTSARAEEGARVFFDAGCASCHAIQGTEAIGGVGPDLTHLASRQTLAAGIVPNDRAHLSRLVTDPWGVKPGNRMPPTQLDDDELDALLDYLETLR